MIKNFMQKYGWKNIALLGVTIITTTIAIIMGIYAVQTVMKTKLKADILPAYKTEIYLESEKTASPVLIFKNFGTVTIAGDTSLEGDKLILSQDFIDDYGQDFSLKIYNYSDFAMQVTITSTAITATGATGMEAEIDKPSQVISASSFATFVITNNSVMTQTITLKLEFDEVPTYNVTYNVENATSNGADNVLGGNDYVATITANNNYGFPRTITVEVGDMAIAPISYTWNYTTGELVIPASQITADITITCLAEAIYTLVSGPNFHDNDTIYYTGSSTLSSVMTPSSVGCKSYQNNNGATTFAPTGPSGPSVTSDTTTTKIIFGKRSDYPRFVKGAVGSSSVAENGGDIEAYRENGVVYVLSDGLIYANPNSSKMFSDYSALTTIIFDNFYTDNVQDMSYMFYVNADNGIASILTTVDISDFNTSNVRNMSYMFAGCSKLSSVDVSNFDTSNVTDMSCMFQGCGSLVTLDLSSFNTSNVTNMSFMFSFCPSLTTIYVGDKWSTASVSDNSSIFFNCTKLAGGAGSAYATYGNVSYAKIDGGTNDPGYLTALGDFNIFGKELPDNVTSLTFGLHSQYSSSVDTWDSGASTNNSNIKMFTSGTNCYFLSNSGDINLNKQTLRAISDYSNIIQSFTSAVFKNCKLGGNASYAFGGFALETLDLSGLDISNVTDMGYMFSNCSAAITFGSNFGAGVTNMSYMFSKYRGTNLDLRNFNTTNVTDMSHMFDDCSAAITFGSNFGAGITNMSYMFANYKKTNLDLSNFNTANVTNMNGMFRSCSRLTTLNLSTFNTTNVTNMSNMFFNCTSLTTLDLSGWDTSNVTDMSCIFDDCRSLTTLDLSSFNTSNVANMGGMFYGCNNLTTLDLSNFNTSNATDMGAMFQGCSSLTTLDLSNFDTTNMTDMGWMFSDCSSLTTLDLSNFNTSNVTAMTYMFSGCSSLTTLDLSNFNTTNVTDMYRMFGNCSSLTTLDLSNFNTSNVTGMNSMFFGCSNITIKSKYATPQDFAGKNNVSDVFYNATCDWQVVA